MTHPTKVRRLTREQYDASRQAWDAGHFRVDVWREWRHLAAMQAGIVMPPEGTEWDSWADENPSERAIVVRAIRETPDALRKAICTPGVHSWAAVIAVLLRGRDRSAADLDERQREVALARRYEATPVQATVVLREILDVIGQS